MQSIAHFIFMIASFAAILNVSSMALADGHECIVPNVTGVETANIGLKCLSAKVDSLVAKNSALQAENKRLSELVANLKPTNGTSPKLPDTQIEQLAQELVDNETIRNVLLRRMNESQMFKGQKGDRGEKGEQGLQGKQGPPINMSLKRFSVGTSKTNPQDQTEQLGVQRFCALSSHSHPHASQACSCLVEPSGNARNWRLIMSVDERASGRCGCQAICANW